MNLSKPPSPHRLADLRVDRRVVRLALSLFAFYLSACLQILPQIAAQQLGVPTPGGSPDAFQRNFLAHFHKAAFSISGDHIFVRSDDTKPWQRVHITLDTDDGYYRQTTGDMEPGQVRELALRGFADEVGKPFGPGIRLKSVWVQARDPDDNLVNELAFPAETFGYKSAVPSSVE